MTLVTQFQVSGAYSPTRDQPDAIAALSRSLGVSLREAEELKRTQGLANETQNKEAHQIIDTISNSIFSETKRMLVNFEKKHKKHVRKIVLTGGGSLLAGVDAVAKEYFEMDIRFSDPFAHVEAPAFLESVLKRAGPEFSVAVGVALRKLQEVK
jgi:Tfp pilus assembly PilM family ATPase